MTRVPDRRDCVTLSYIGPTHRCQLCISSRSRRTAVAREPGYGLDHAATRFRSEEQTIMNLENRLRGRSSTVTPRTSRRSFAVGWPALILAVALAACGSSTQAASTSTPSLSPAKEGIASVSCPTKGSCWAAGVKGHVWAYSSGKWIARGLIDPSFKGWSTWTPNSLAPANLSFVSAMSCATAAFCSAVDESGRAFTYDRGTWSAPTTVVDHPTYQLLAVSCAAERTCVTVGAAGSAATYQLGHWSRLADAPDYTLATISCPTATYCVVGGSDDTVFTLANGRWRPGVALDRAANNGPVGDVIDAVSCPSTRYCLATDNLGNFFIFRNGAWSSAKSVSPKSLVIVAASCATETSCLGVDEQGGTHRWNGSAWSAGSTPQEKGGDGWPRISVSCPTPGWCMVEPTGRVRLEE